MQKNSKKLKLVAHRGASLEYPCNSLESLVNGARMGADWVECDVRQIVGGRFVMCSTPERGMDGTEASLDKIASLGADGALLNDIRMGLAWRARS